MLFTGLTNKKRRKKIRGIIRGYRILKKDKRLNLIEELKSKMSKCTFSDNQKHYSVAVFGAAHASAELVVKQYMYSKFLLNNKFNKAVLYSIGTKSHIVYPLPKQWIDLLSESGILIRKKYCMTYWSLIVTIYWFYGVFKGVKYLVSSALCLPYIKNKKLIPYVYFSDLPSNAVPKENNDVHTHNIINWYILWSKKKGKRYRLIMHDAPGINSNVILDKVLISQSPLFDNVYLRLHTYFIYFGWIFRLIALSVIDVALFRWWNLLLFSQAVDARKIKYASINCIPLDSLFNNQGHLYRPLWTYEAENRGARILFYFYSCNNEVFKTSSGYSEIPNGWDLTNWPLYLVWDEYNNNFVKRIIGSNSNTEIVGPIWFSGLNKKIPNPQGKIISVFDVVPRRSSLYAEFLMGTDYYIPEIVNQFFEDICDVLGEKAFIFYKKKRSIGKNEHRKYTNSIFRLQKKYPNKFVSVDPDIAALELIKKSYAVISLPFTSTAIIAKEYGKTSIYYDPSGIIKKEDRAAHGIVILTGKKELTDWIKKINL